MNKSQIVTLLKQTLADRPVAVSLLVFVLVCVAYVVYVLTSLHPSDLQVAVHYTAFGEANFYRARWYYLLSFAGLGLVFALIHSSIAVKIHAEGRRQLALGFIWLSVFLVIITWIITRSILGVAFPS